MKKVKEVPYWECSRCELNSTLDHWCPCPRGNCEAEVVGKVITTIEIIKNEK